MKALHKHQQDMAAFLLNQYPYLFTDTSEYTKGLIVSFLKRYEDEKAKAKIQIDTTKNK